jgi:hypothetical protein
MFKKSSPLKLLGQMEPNLAGSIYIRSSIKTSSFGCWSFFRFPILLTVFELLPKTSNFTICSIFSNSGHVCWPNGTKWRSFYRGSCIDASYQVWLHLAQQFQRKIFP